MNEAHTLSAYDEELDALGDSIQEMGQLVRELIVIAAQALDEPRKDLADKAAQTDKKINALDLDIEHQATIVLALRNPMAVDLRFVTSSIKMATIWERMGDIAKKVAKRSLELGDYRPEDSIAQLKHMSTIVTEMIDEILLAIDEVDEKKAKQITQKDEQLDVLYDTVFSQIQQEMARNPSNAPASTHIIFLAKNFERLGDYVTNLAKAVNYVSSGHRSFRKSRKRQGS